MIYEALAAYTVTEPGKGRGRPSAAHIPEVAAAAPFQALPLAADNPEGDASFPYQKHRHTQHYYTEKDWSDVQQLVLLQQQGHDISKALAAAIARMMIRCGWLKVEETDYAKAVGSVAGTGAVVTGTTGLQIVKDLKSIHRAAALNPLAQVKAQGYVLVNEYPADPRRRRRFGAQLGRRRSAGCRVAALPPPARYPPGGRGHSGAHYHRRDRGREPHGGTD